ncbi:MAG: DUF4177 domain-containing protein [Erysipelotrichaceae bacterium]|nr:DUF4177 domain-containing protein [Erysipelotrichaceae bacterium]
MGLFDNNADKPYVALQVILKEGLIGAGMGNIGQLEDVINNQCAKGYRLHTMTTTVGGTKGLAGGDRMVAILVFEKIANQA